MSQGNFMRTIAQPFPSICIARQDDDPCSGKSDFYRLCRGLHDNSANAAYAKCAAAAAIATIAAAKRVITW